MSLARIAVSRVAALAVSLATALSGCGQGKSATSPTPVTTCELRDDGSKYEGVQVAVQAVIRTDLMHYQNIESTACAHKPVAMYFATDSKFNPCGDSAFAKSLQCPLNALDYRIEATFIGTYHAADRALEVNDLKGFTRTKLH